MKTSTIGLGLLAAAGLFVAGERTANACGGCFHPPTQTASDITDERMLLSVSASQTTLYDQIRYAGSPKSFAWVLPIHGTVDVGLSADVLFDSVDALTATQVRAPASSCAPYPSQCFTASAGNASSAPGAEADHGVTVTKQQNVGPYATVQLHATDPGALDKWLAANGFSIPKDVTPVIDQYVKEGFDFLAMKLLPNQGVQAMRPVRVTSPGASLSLPLRMAAVGTGASVGITIWVVADGRYEPQNFPSFQIADKDLVWDWKTSQSNYTTLRATNAAKFQGKGWELESSLDLNQQTVTSTILSGGRVYGGNGAGGPQGGPSGAPASSATDDYLPVGDPNGGAGGSASTPYQSAEEVRTADIKALFAGMAGPNVRITRMRSDISHAAMTTDFVLKASSDQSEISNVRLVKQSVNEVCPVYQDCQQVGTEPAPSAAGGPGGAGGTKSSVGGCVVSEGSSGPSNFGVGGLAAAFALVVTRLFRSSPRSKND